MLPAARRRPRGPRRRRRLPCWAGGGGRRSSGRRPHPGAAKRTGAGCQRGAQPGASRRRAAPGSRSATTTTCGRLTSCARSSMPPDDAWPGWVYTGSVNVNEAGRVVGGTLPLPPSQVVALLPRRNVVPGGGSGVLVHRRLLDRAGPFDLRLHNTEDWDLWVRLSRLETPRRVPAPAGRATGSTAQAPRWSPGRSCVGAEEIERRYGGPLDRVTLYRHLGRLCGTRPAGAGRRCAGSPARRGCRPVLAGRPVGRCLDWPVRRGRRSPSGCTCAARADGAGSRLAAYLASAAVARPTGLTELARHTCPTPASSRRIGARRCRTSARAAWAPVAPRLATCHAGATVSTDGPARPNVAAAAWSAARASRAAGIPPAPRPGVARHRALARRCHARAEWSPARGRRARSPGRPADVRRARRTAGAAARCPCGPAPQRIEVGRPLDRFPMHLRLPAEEDRGPADREPLGCRRVVVRDVQAEEREQLCHLPARVGEPGPRSAPAARPGRRRRATVMNRRASVRRSGPPARRQVEVPRRRSGRMTRRPRDHPGPSMITCAVGKNVNTSVDARRRSGSW